MNCIKITRSDREGYTIVTVDEITNRIKEEFDNPFWIAEGVKLTLEVVEMVGDLGTVADSKK